MNLFLFLIVSLLSIVFIETFENDKIEDMLNSLNLNKKVSLLLQEQNGFDKSLIGDITGCYVDNVKNSSINIFDGKLEFKSLVDFYYKSFSENELSVESIVNLLDSTKDIFKRCINRGSSSVQFGLTSLSDKSENYIKKMLGNLYPIVYSSSVYQGLSGKDPRCRPSVALPKSFDWRKKKVVTRVKNQGSCGSCWTFATVGALESALLIKANSTNKDIDLSEQQLVSCAKSFGCGGGTSYHAFEYLIKNGGITSESLYPYQGQSTFCMSNNKPPVASIRQYCIRSRFRYTYDFVSERLSDKDIQQALVANGPLYVIFDSNPLATRNYRGGIFNDPTCTTQINHAVLLVGYTPEAWILKNSWGSYWGDNGYFMLARHKNLCGINTEIAFPLL